MNKRNDNYPDDIRQYDDDPRSPFYVESDDIEYPEDFDDGLGDWLYEQQKDADLDRYLNDLADEQNVLSEYERRLDQ